MTKNIIILEDAFKLAATWVEALRAQGHTVTAFIRVQSFADGKITGENEFNVASTVEVDSLDVAICDGLLAFGKVQGFECVPLFLAAGIPCISTSSGGDITDGKGHHVDKEFVLGCLEEILQLARKVE